MCHQIYNVKVNLVLAGFTNQLAVEMSEYGTL